VPVDAPGKTDTPTVALSPLDATQVQVSWNLPNEHSSPITSYDILFMTSSGSMVYELTRCDGSLPSVVADRSCSVPMATLRNLTLLPRDSLIRAQVRATNARGTGQYSEINTAGATIETEPTNLTVVSIDVPSTTNNATMAVWTALTGSSRGGMNVLITQYEVYWDQSNDTWVSLANTTNLN